MICPVKNIVRFWVWAAANWVANNKAAENNRLLINEFMAFIVTNPSLNFAQTLQPACN